jgi:hypothetical protein
MKNDSGPVDGADGGSAQPARTNGAAASSRVFEDMAVSRVKVRR